MKLTKRGTIWWVDFRLPDGRRKRVTTGEQEQALAYKRAAEIVTRAVNGAAEAGPATKLGALLWRTFDEHWSKTRSAHIMRHTVSMLDRHVGHLLVPDVTYGTLKDYCEARLKEGTAPATVNRRMSCIGVALREAVRRGELVARPPLPHYAENNRKERYVTPAEEAEILSWLDREAGAEAHRANFDKAAEWLYLRDLAIVLIDTGMRFSEAFVACPNGRALDLPHGTTKTGAGRQVPLTGRAAEAWAKLSASPLHRRLAADPAPKGAWDWVSYRWQRAVKACQCEDVTLHILRHTCASRLVQRGVPIYTVSKWLGHSSVKVTERYAKLAPDAFGDALIALEAGLHGTQLVSQRTDSSEKRTHPDEVCP